MESHTPQNDFTRSPLLSIVFDDGSTVEVTTNHPLFSVETGGYKQAGTFIPGESVKTQSGEKAIVSMEVLLDTPVVYNIETDHESQNYFAGNILAHTGLEEPSGSPMGSLVETPEGSVAIESVKPGDHVYGYDIETGERVLSTVETVFLQDEIYNPRLNYDLFPLMEVTLDDGAVLRATANQQFYAPEYKKWVELSFMSEGMAVISSSGNESKVTSVATLTDRPGKLYKLAVKEKNRNYFAGGVLIHNALGSILKSGMGSITK